jgi:hypothetical protein
MIASRAGDSYVVLETIKQGDVLRHHVFFWQGKETSQVILLMDARHTALMLCSCKLTKDACSWDGAVHHL